MAAGGSRTAGPRCNRGSGGKPNLRSPPYRSRAGHLRALRAPRVFPPQVGDPSVRCTPIGAGDVFGRTKPKNSVISVEAAPGREGTQFGRAKPTSSVISVEAARRLAVPERLARCNRCGGERPCLRSRPYRSRAGRAGALRAPRVFPPQVGDPGVRCTPIGL